MAVSAITSTSCTITWVHSKDTFMYVMMVGGVLVNPFPVVLPGTTTPISTFIDGPASYSYTAPTPFASGQVVSVSLTPYSGSRVIGLAATTTFTAPVTAVSAVVVPTRYTSFLASSLTPALASGATVTSWPDASGTKPLVQQAGRAAPVFQLGSGGNPSVVRWIKSATNQPLLIDGWGTNGSTRVLPLQSDYTRMMLVYVTDAASANGNQACWWGPWNTAGHFIWSGWTWGILQVGAGNFGAVGSSSFAMGNGAHYCIFQTYNKSNGRITWNMNGAPNGDPTNNALPVGGLNRTIPDSPTEIGGIAANSIGYGPSIDVIELATWNVVLTPEQMKAESARLALLYNKPLNPIA
jgi:hypothetical protein